MSVPSLGEACGLRVDLLLPTHLSILFFVWVEALRPSQYFSVMSGLRHCFLGISCTFWEVNVSCSRIQHGDLSEDPTPDVSLRSPTLYH